jgi:DNA-binding PadR family transcriptional regulator
MARIRTDSAQTLAVLRELLADPAVERHGYDLAKATGLASGTLYPILIRLADRRLLSARWEIAAKPRHVYRLTRAGERHARERLEPRAKPALGGKAYA